MIEDLALGVKGQSFYMHEVKKQQSVTLTEIIIRLGGKVDSFLNKDVNVVVTGSKGARGDLLVDSPSAGPRGKQNGTGAPKPLVCGSRGKTLLEKVIQNSEKCQSSVLANARSWGVKIVNVDEFIKFIDQKQKLRRAEDKGRKLSASRIKAGVLKCPYLKVEDYSRKYRPSYMQALSFPMMSYSGKFSPFEFPKPLESGRRNEQKPSNDKFRANEDSTPGHNKLLAPPNQNPTPRGPTKKDSGYCECCQIAYKDQYEHLRSEMHRSFVQNSSNYTVVDEVTAGMHASFFCNPNQEVDSMLIKFSAGCSPSGHLTEMVQHTDSQTERSLHMTSIPGCDPLPPITDRSTQALDNRGHTFEPNQCPPALNLNFTSHLCTKQNDCPDPLDTGLDPEKTDLYTFSATKLQGHVLSTAPPLSSVFSMNLVTHHISLKVRSVDQRLKSIPSVSPSDTHSKTFTVSSSRDNKILCTVPGDELISRAQSPFQDLHDTGDGGYLFHISKAVTDPEMCSVQPATNNVSLPNRKQGVNEDSTMLSNSPKCCGQLVMDRKIKEPLKASRDIMGTSKDGISCFLSHNFLPFPCVSDNLLSLVNLKKRCRSFSLSPKHPKKRRISSRQKEKSDPSCGSDAPWLKKYSAIVSTIAYIPVPKTSGTTDMTCSMGETKLKTQEHSLHGPSLIPVKSSHTCVTAPCYHRLSNHVDQKENVESQACVFVENSDHLSSTIRPLVESHLISTSSSSDSGPPQLFPFFHEDQQLQLDKYHDPPELFPVFCQATEDTLNNLVSKNALNSSVQSHSGASVCIESSLLPNLTCSTASSESDWDSGLMSWFTSAIPLQSKGGRDKQNLELLLQKPCTGIQDENYTSQLSSVLLV